MDWRWHKMDSAPRDGSPIFLKRGRKVVGLYVFSRGTDIYPYRTWEPVGGRHIRSAYFVGDEGSLRWFPAPTGQEPEAESV